MTLPWTLLLLLGGCALALVGRLGEARPRELGQPPLLPPALVMGLGLVMAVVAGAHLVALVTGLDFAGRHHF